MAEGDDMIKEGQPNNSETPIDSVDDAPQDPSRREFLRRTAAGALTSLLIGAGLKGSSEQDWGMPNDETEMAPNADALLPTHENLPMTISGRSLNTLSPDQKATFDSQVYDAQEWVVQVSNIAEQIKDVAPELSDAVGTFVAAVGNNTRPPAEYALPLGQKQSVINSLVPDFGDGKPGRPGEYLNLVVNTAGGNARLAYTFHFEPKRWTDPTIDEEAAFDLLYSVLKFNKYKGLVESLPDPAFDDIAALRAWLNSDEVRFRLDTEVYKELGRIYSRVSPTLRQSGLSASPTYKQVYDKWILYRNDPRPGVDYGPRGPEAELKLSWYRDINFLFYGRRIDLNPISPNSDRLLRPLDIPWS